MRKQFPGSPCVNATLNETRKIFGANPHAWHMTDEDREAADSFDVSKALETAIAQRAAHAHQPDQEQVFVTGWFEDTVTPRQVGMYQREFGASFGHSAVTYAMWDGSRWLRGGASIAEAQEYLCASEKQEQHWRGLSAPTASMLPLKEAHQVSP